MYFINEESDDESDNSPGRARAKNFKAYEMEFLMSLIAQEPVIVSKNTDGKLTKLKKDAWARVMYSFNNADFTTKRNWESLKAKYDNLRKVLRKQLRENKGEINTEKMHDYERSMLREIQIEETINKVTGKPKRKKFSKENMALLVDLVEKESIIECKKSKMDIWKSKQDAWLRITNAFNASQNENYTFENLRGKYERIKQLLREKIAKNEKIANDLEKEPLEEYEFKILCMRATDGSEFTDSTPMEENVEDSFQFLESSQFNLGTFEPIIEESVMDDMQILPDSTQNQNLSQVKAKEKPIKKKTPSLTKLLNSQTSVLDLDVKLKEKQNEYEEKRLAILKYEHDMQVEMLKADIAAKQNELDMMQAMENERLQQLAEEHELKMKLWEIELQLKNEELKKL